MSTAPAGDTNAKKPSPLVIVCAGGALLLSFALCVGSFLGNKLIGAQARSDNPSSTDGDKKTNPTDGGKEKPAPFDPASKKEHERFLIYLMSQPVQYTEAYNLTTDAFQSKMTELDFEKEMRKYTVFQGASAMGSLHWKTPEWHKDLLVYKGEINSPVGNYKFTMELKSTNRGYLVSDFKIEPIPVS